MKPENGRNSRNPDADSTAADQPPFLREITRDRIVAIDVRPFFEKGEEPFAAIMEAIGRVGEGEVLELTVPFEPLPLFGVLRQKGFSNWSRPPENPEDPWTIYFYRETENEPEFFGETEAENEDEGIDEIDVRGLEPPEPMERVLEALEELGYGRVLLVRHHREPLILYDVLGERGFSHRGKEIAENEWEIRIWRKG